MIIQIKSNTCKYIIPNNAFYGVKVEGKENLILLFGFNSVKSEVILPPNPDLLE